jgi:hypothetical protein
MPLLVALQDGIQDLFVALALNNLANGAPLTVTVQEVVYQALVVADAFNSLLNYAPPTAVVGVSTIVLSGYGATVVGFQSTLGVSQPGVDVGYEHDLVGAAASDAFSLRVDLTPKRPGFSRVLDQFVSQLRVIQQDGVVADSTVRTQANTTANEFVNLLRRQRYSVFAGYQTPAGTGYLAGVGGNTSHLHKLDKRWPNLLQHGCWLTAASIEGIDLREIDGTHQYAGRTGVVLAWQDDYPTLSTGRGRVGNQQLTNDTVEITRWRFQSGAEYALKNPVDSSDSLGVFARWRANPPTDLDDKLTYYFWRYVEVGLVASFSTNIGIDHSWRAGVKIGTAF